MTASDLIDLDEGPCGQPPPDGHTVVRSMDASMDEGALAAHTLVAALCRPMHGVGRILDAAPLTPRPRGRTSSCGSPRAAAAQPATGSAPAGGAPR
jgi:hypothetical protein